MLLLFSVSIANWPPVWERAVHSVFLPTLTLHVFHGCLSVFVCVFLFF